ncbi:hypothetical protein RHMOL_Rhmol07G0007900 [Rhododendron molle]|uniref:Uncharacterized protein n=1 Tax=Rhododendron molle TaxID=49168 RepID=A0ACC0MWM5_RHOML|nr:hypothetical protein RHMOL_Rhmol07G0007900 [Rhododendron molle]
MFLAEVSSIEWEVINMTEQEEDMIYRMHKLVGDRDRGLPNNCFTHQLQLSASASGEKLSMSLKFGNQWEAWLMQEYKWCRGLDSWMRQFSLAGEQILWPLKLMDNGNVLLEMQSGNLVSCDAENQQMKDLGISSLQSGFRIFTCTSSLILLDRGEKLLG